MAKGFDDEANAPSYYVRLGSISTKLRQRAYQKAIYKVHDAKKNSQEYASQLNRTMDVVGDLQSLKISCFFFFFLFSIQMTVTSELRIGCLVKLVLQLA